MDRRHEWSPPPQHVGEADLPFLLRMAHQRVERLVAGQLGEPGLGQGLDGVHLLRRATAGEGLGVRTTVLTEYLGVRQQSASRRILGLERAGLLDCSRDPFDGRISVVAPSDEGLDVIARYAEVVRELLNLVGDHVEIDAAHHRGDHDRAASLDTVQRFEVTARTLAVLVRACA